MIQKNTYTFIVATLSLVAIFAISSAPVPMLGLFQQTFHMTGADLAMTAVCYFLGCIPALLFCSRLPNRLGRKPVVVLALTIGAISSLAVIFATAPLHIMLARIGQGFACGLASGSAMAWIFDSAPAHNRSISAMLAASGPGIGFLFGALAAAIAYELFAISHQHIFTGLFVGLVTVLVLSLFGKETVTHPSGTLWQTLTPKLEIPQRLKKEYLLAVATYAGTWGVGGFFQAYSAQIASDALHSSNMLTAAFVFLSFIGTNALGSFCIKRLQPKEALNSFIFLFGCCVCLMFFFLHNENFVLFFIFCVFSGISVGASCSAALRIVTQNAQSQERTGLLAAVYLAAYLGPGLPNLIIGQLKLPVTIEGMSWFYGAWAIVFTVIVLIGSRLVLTPAVSHEEHIR